MKSTYVISLGYSLTSQTSCVHTRTFSVLISTWTVTIAIIGSPVFLVMTMVSCHAAFVSCGILLLIYTRDGLPLIFTLAAKLSLYPEEKQKHSYLVSSQTLSNSPGISSGEVSYATSRQQSYNLPGGGFGNRGRIQPRQLKCTYCSGLHEARFCQQYDTPLKRRERLVVLDRCRACMMLLSAHQDVCSPNAFCSHHPRERHFWHLCDGPQLRGHVQ